MAMLVSCGGTKTPTGGETSGSGDSVSGEGTSSSKAEPKFAKEDNGGEAFRIYAPDWGLYSTYFFADEQNGDQMNDAIYERERKVEEYLGVNIEYTKKDTINEVKGVVNQTIMSSDDSYQLFLTHCIYSVSDMITNNMLYDWNDFEYCDFDADYWNQSCMKNLEVGGHNYYAVSDYMLPDPNAILFNKDMVTEFSLENPYEIVRSGKWTFDKFIQMCSTVTGDLNGDSVMDENDRYGLGTRGNWWWNSFLYSSGLHLAKRADDGTFSLDIDNNKMTTLVEKLDQLANKSGDMYKFADNDEESKRLTIASGKVLFFDEAVNALGKYRDTTVEYGILPYPKFDENQKDYINNDWSGLMCVPVNVGNPELVGKVIELLAFYSGDTTIPAYFNLVLGEKLARDEDSKEMLNIIFDNIIYDPGMNYFGFQENMMNLFYTFGRLVVNEGRADYASWYAKNASGAETAIEKFNREVVATEK